jgi:HEAT repeat protein
LLALALHQCHERSQTVGGRSAPQWSLLLLTGNATERQQAEAALRALGDRAVPSLCRALLKPDSRLHSFGQRVARRTPAGIRVWMQRTLLSPDPQTRRIAASHALAVLGPAAAAAVPDLAAELAHPNSSEAWGAGRALAQIGSAAVPAVIPLLDDSNPAVQLQATWVLKQIGEDAQAALPALTRQIGTTNPALATATIQALGRIWTNPLPEYANLLHTLRGPPREAVARAARSFNFPARALQPPLTEMLKDPSPSARQMAVLSLGALTGWTAETFIGLHRAQNDPDAGVRTNATAILAQHELRPHTPPSSLAEVLADPNGEFRVQAAQSLGRLGRGAASAVPTLEAATHAADPALRSAALEALARLTNAPPRLGTDGQSDD